MSDRGREIETFFWLLMRLVGMGLGSLMIAGGILFALAFALEQAGTGAVAINGREYTGLAARIWVVAIPAAVAAAGWVLVRATSRWRPGAS